MTNYAFGWLAATAVALLVVTPILTASGLQPAEAAKKPPEGTTGSMHGVAGSENMVTATDPLWERYAYAGKRCYERHDIASAQRYYWATCFELEDAFKRDPKTKVSATGEAVLIDILGISNDVFFQDPNPAGITKDPPPYDQPIAEDEKTRIDAEEKRLADEQAAFDKAHPTVDGGSRLRMTHLRQRIEFGGRLLPICNKLLGADDAVTKMVSDQYDSDVSEFKDMETQI